MAESGDVDTLCLEFFHMCVEKEQAKKLPDAEKKLGKGTTVRKILTSIGENSTTISSCEASVMPKHQDKKTKKISDVDFLKKLLPEVAALKTKSKVGDAKAEDELSKMKRKMCTKLEEMKNAKTGKSAAVVDRLTDTSKYTGSHQQRFDESGKGKGKEGREDKVDDSGYVGAYKGEGTYGKK